MAAWYPSKERLIELNMLILNAIQVKKADKAEVLSQTKLRIILETCKEHTGDVYDKASSLLKGIITSHAFASGNRRTAFVATKEFITRNGERFKIKNNIAYAEVMKGIREGYYTDKEIKEWIQHGTIKTFKR